MPALFLTVELTESIEQTTCHKKKVIHTNYLKSKREFIAGRCKTSRQERPVALGLPKREKACLRPSLEKSRIYLAARLLVSAGSSSTVRRRPAAANLAGTVAGH